MNYRKLGDLLVSGGLITNLQLTIALAAQQTSNRRLGEILVERGFATEEQIADCLADQYGYPRADLESVAPQPAALSVLKPDLALEHCVLPVRNDDNDFECVIADPLDVATTDLVAHFVRKRLILHIAPQSQLIAKIREAYGLEEKGALESAAQEVATPDRFGSLRPRKRVSDVTLFDAFDHQLDRKVTLTMVAGNSDAEARYQRIVQAAGRTPSKSVCAVHDWFPHGSASWAVLERVEGESLGHVLRTRGARTLSQAAELVSQLAEGVDALNQAGGRCGLVSPENVLIGPAGAKLTPLVEPAPEYTAPEIEMGDAGSHLSDVYALGTLLWECVTGENPHISAAVKTGARYSWALPNPNDPQLPAALIEILSRCLAREPQDRYPSAILVSNALRSYNWIALAIRSEAPTSTSTDDRDELLSVMSDYSAPAKPTFWQRLFGRAA